MTLNSSETPSPLTPSRLEEAARQPVDVAILKSWDFAGWQARYGAGQLPYRIDHLEQHGLRLHWTDALHRPQWERSRVAGALRQVEGVTVPFVQAALMARVIATSPITLAMFESEANALAVVRNLGRLSKRRAIFAVLTSWLAHILATSGTVRRSAYRSAYRSVDRLYYFSANQGSLLAEHLTLDEDRLRFVAFGVDDETFRPTGERDGDYVLVVGRDRGRDWPTLLRAVDGIGLPVKICSRPRDLEGLRIPGGVELLGYVDRDTYRGLLGRARVVAVASKPRLYPSGQSVLLEAMAMARAVVVTRTPALESYINDGRTALAVPWADPAALRQRILEAAADDELRRRVGQEGRRAVERQFNARTMWATIATDLLELLDARG